MKINNDKYYTPKELAKYCIDKTYEIIGKENISEILEPSAGNGSFSSQIKNCLAYDILPETEGIIKQDYLTLELSYKKNRLIIGNPPYGSRMNMAQKFFKKSVELGDYIAFILPISQLDNISSLYEFDLIYSEDLGEQYYTDRKLHCCFNIYKRNPSGKLNKKPNYKLKDVEVKEYRRNGTYLKPIDYDFAICAWGNGTCGNKVEYVGQYAQEIYITVKNDKFRDKIIKLCENTDWRHLYSSISSAKLQTWKVYKYFAEQIKNIS